VTTSACPKPLALLLGILAVSAAVSLLHAAHPPVAAAAVPGEIVEEEFEEGEFEEGEFDEEGACEEVEAEDPDVLQEDEESEETLEGDGETCRNDPPPRPCPLRDADARVLLRPAAGRITLLLRYDVSAPAAISIRSRLRGGRGAVTLPTASRRVRGRGLVRIGERLGSGARVRALSAHRLTIWLRVSPAPRRCRPEVEHLTLRRSGGGRVAWR
jgi:hypothetical protein